MLSVFSFRRLTSGKHQSEKTVKGLKLPRNFAKAPLTIFFVGGTIIERRKGKFLSNV